jgi:hypothetical protein
MSPSRRAAAFLAVTLLLTTPALFAAPPPHPAAAPPTAWEAAVAQVRALLAHVVLPRPLVTTQCDNNGNMDPDGRCKP